MTSRLWHAPLAFVLLLAGTTDAPAQTSLGRIVGVVQDATGENIPGASIRVVHQTTGQLAVLISGADGRFVSSPLPAGPYTVIVESLGFKTATYANVKVNTGQEYSLTAALQIGQISESVLVEAGADLVHTTTPEIINTVTQEQIQQLPLNGRNPIELVRLQAGVVGIPTRTNSAINGGRPTWSHITMDGVNIQDNYIRSNAVDFSPNRPTPDNVAEFTIVTNTQGVDAVGGASQVRLVTPSGGNDVHGSLFEFNRNSRFSANEWFNNRDGIERPYLNRNQFGGSLSGPLLKNKLFAFGYYEGLRQSEEDSPNNVIPRNDDLLTGVFRYGNGRSVDLLQLSGLSLDPQVRSAITSRIHPASKVNNRDVGDGVNTGGYRFIQQDRNTRDHFGGRLDYAHDANHRFEIVGHRMSQRDDRTDIDLVNEEPQVYTRSTATLLTGAWRWQITPNLHHELRVGSNRAPVDFETTIDYGDALFTLPLALSNPVEDFQPQGRNSWTRQLASSGTWVSGRHSVQFGGSLQQTRVNTYGDNGPPDVTFGFSPAAPASIQLTAAQFPGGISASDLARANDHLAFLAGVVSQVEQTFEVRDRTSGFVPGYPNDRTFNLDTYGLYVQDNWSLLPNLTIRAGLKWEYYTPLKERDDLALLPILNGRPVRDVLLDPEGAVDFVSGPLYRADRNNFAPSIGVAWDPFGNGKTSVRAGYTKAFVNEETIRVGENAVTANDGLSTTITNRGLFARLATGIPAVPVPDFKMPRTFADQQAASATAVGFAVDPELRQPSVHQLSVSVERQLGADFGAEVRYIGNLGRDLYRGVDLNQIRLSAEYMADFDRARRNGFLALQQTGVFNPAYNPAIPGSQALTVIPRFGGGFLTNGTARTRIQQGQAAGLADLYVQNQISPSREYFLANPRIFAADLVVNGADTDYHGLQLELRRRARDGVSAQINYTFSKALSTSPGTGQTRFEPLLDNARPELERARAPFDTTHVVHANVVYELPFGKGKRLLNRDGWANRLAGGWTVSTIFHWQSGSPFSILSSRGTFNRAGRSGGNTANSSLSRQQIKKLLGLRKQPDGKIYFIDPSVIDTTGRAVGPDQLDPRAQGFPGQVFFNPGAGEVGELQRLQFDGPAQASWDMSVIKRMPVGRRLKAELRVDVFNVTNHPYFYLDDDNFGINSTTFGLVSELNQAPRIVQMAVRLSF